MWITKISLVFCTLAFTNAFDYKGYKIYEAVPQQQDEADFLNALGDQTEEIDFFALSKIPNTAARALVSPIYQLHFEKALTNYGINYTIINDDVSESIEEEKRHNTIIEPRGRIGRISFNKFYRHADINAYMEELQRANRQSIVVDDVGKSYEGRPIKTITITNGVSTGKRTLFIDAGIHAREWIAPAAALYLIQQLAENTKRNADLLEKFNFIILPVVNPDGYEYTHTDSRFWRKTRKPTSRQCVGTDGNRNFGFHWAEVGSSSNTCSDTYHGPKPFSEPETEIVRRILHDLQGDALLYLTLHSYGNYFLYPWGYTSKLPENAAILDEVARAGANAIKSATGSRYTVGSSTNVLYAAAGGSDDYALGVCKIPISITMELPGGGTGFDPHPTQIAGMVEETFVGIRAMVLKIKEKYLRLRL